MNGMQGYQSYNAFEEESKNKRNGSVIERDYTIQNEKIHQQRYPNQNGMKKNINSRENGSKLHPYDQYTHPLDYSRDPMRLERNGLNRPMSHPMNHRLGNSMSHQYANTDSSSRHLFNNYEKNIFEQVISKF